MKTAANFQSFNAYYPNLVSGIDLEFSLVSF